MRLPSLDRIRRTLEDLRTETEAKTAAASGELPPDLQKKYREWAERDPDAALFWRIQQPGFSFPDLIRAANELDEEARRKREAGEFGDDELSESEDLDHEAEPETEELDVQPVNSEPERLPEPQDGPEATSILEDEPEPSPAPSESPPGEEQTERPKPATPGGPWNPWPRQSLRDTTKGWL